MQMMQSLLKPGASRSQLGVMAQHLPLHNTSSPQCTLHYEVLLAASEEKACIMHTAHKDMQQLIKI
jgi:hypothetical protein